MSKLRYQKGRVSIVKKMRRISEWMNIRTWSVRRLGARAVRQFASSRYQRSDPFETKSIQTAVKDGISKRTNRFVADSHLLQDNQPPILTNHQWISRASRLPNSPKSKSNSTTKSSTSPTPSTSSVAPKPNFETVPKASMEEFLPRLPVHFPPSRYRNQSRSCLLFVKSAKDV